MRNYAGANENVSTSSGVERPSFQSVQAILYAHMRNHLAYRGIILGLHECLRDDQRKLKHHARLILMLFAPYCTDEGLAQLNQAMRSSRSVT